jgi:hypothetical protein
MIKMAQHPQRWWDINSATSRAKEFYKFMDPSARDFASINTLDEFRKVPPRAAAPRRRTQ